MADIVGHDNAQRYAAKFGDLDAVAFPNGITGMEALAFYVYTTEMAWHITINQQLWSSSPHPSVVKFAAVIDGALVKMPTMKGKAATVFRGYNTPDPEAFLDVYVVGNQVLFPGLTSAAFKLESAFGGNVLFIIRSLTARVIWFLCAGFYEDEVLLPTGRKFNVVDVVDNGKRYVVTLEEV